MKTIEFYKMTAGGNDFVVVDNREKLISFSGDKLVSFIKEVCNRKFGVGADGVILLENSKKASIKMRYFNADGSEVSMCGNGARCISKFAYLVKVIKRRKGSLETPAGVIHFELKPDTVKILLSKPKDIRLDFPLKVEKKEFNASFINTGVPHVIIFVSDIDKVDVEKLGRMIRYHREFAPDGTNSNFVYVKDRSNLLVRTYERGVEGETLACGTGVAAAAIVSGLKNLVDSPVNCHTKGGDTLTVSYIKNKNNLLSPVSSVYLEGPVKLSFTGKLKVA